MTERKAFDPRLWAQMQLLETIMERIGFPVGVVPRTGGWRDPEMQRRLWARGRDAAGNVIDRSAVVTWARPGSSKHERTDAEGRPRSEAADYMARGRENPWDPTFPWGVLRTVAVEVCGLHCVSMWDPTLQRFRGDLGHVELL